MSRAKLTFKYLIGLHSAYIIKSSRLHILENDINQKQLTKSLEEKHNLVL